MIRILPRADLSRVHGGHEVEICDREADVVEASYM
jgi:hypothetical protein